MPQLATVPSHNVHLIGAFGRLSGGESKAGKSILLLEDDPVFHEIMSEFLTECGFGVVGVSDGADGIPQVLAEDFDVILCDMMMPKVSGEMFFREVERTKPHLCDRFVFMTGHFAHPQLRAFVESVQASFLAKPFQVDDLLRTIDHVRERIQLDKAA